MRTPKNSHRTPGVLRGLSLSSPLFTQVRAAVALVVVAALQACVDIPTEAPTLDQRWVIAGDSTTLSVDRVLPGSVIASGNAFVVTIPAVTVTQSVSDFCPQCQVGAVALPKPAFVASFATTASLPADVASATLVSGAVVVSLSHAMLFDPLRPSSTSRGSIVFTISNNGAVIGRDSIDGANLAMPANVRLDRVIGLRAGAVIAGSIDVAVRVLSPAGDPTSFTSGQGITVVATPNAVRIGRATVLLNSRMVTSTATTLDLSGVGSEVRDRVQGGALLIAVTNPFAVRGTMSLTLSGTALAPINKTFRLEASSSGSAEQRLEFTRDELRALLGTSDLRLTITGPVSGTGVGGAAELLPSTQVVVSTKLDVALRVGGISK